MERLNTQLLNTMEAEKPVQTQNRLCTSNIIYNDRDKCHIIVKTISFNQTINFFDHMDKIKKNYGVYQSKIGSSAFYVLPHIKDFQRNENYAFLMQRQALRRTLNERITNSVVAMSPIDTFWILSQVLFSVAQMHLLHLPHCNLSCSNILLTSSDDVYLTDMGLIQPHLFRRQDYNVVSLFYPNNHSELYLSPERLTKKTEYLNLELSADDQDVAMLMKSDVFALGCIMYKFVSGGKVLFNLPKLYKVIETENYRDYLKADLEEIKNPDFRELILDMVNPKWEERAGVQDVFRRWNSFFLNSPLQDQAVIYHFGFLLRQQTLSRPDFQVFLVNVFFSMAQEKGMFGIIKSNASESTEMLMLVFARFFELLGSSKVADFMHATAPLFQADPSTAANAELLNDIYKKAEQLLKDCYIKPPISNRLIDVVTRQNESEGLKDSRKSQHLQLDLAARRKDALTRILSFMTPSGFRDRPVVSFIFMRHLMSNFLDCDSEEGIHLGLIAIKKYIINVSSKDILVHILPVLYTGLKSRHQKIFKLKFLRTLIYALKSIRFLDCPDFSRLCTIEKYIMSVVRYIFTSGNELLMLTLLKNFKTFIKVSLILSMSHVRVVEGRTSLSEILASKTYIANYFEIRNFFVQKIEQALDNPNLTTVVLRQIHKFLHFISDFWSLQNLLKFTLKFIQKDNAIADAVLLFPFLLNNECQLVRSHIKILTSVLSSDREEILLASLAAITTVIKIFRTLDPLFFKNEILRPLHDFYRRAPTHLTKARVIQVYQYLFKKLPEEDINLYFREDIEKICDVKNRIGYVTKPEIERVLSKIIFSEDLTVLVQPVSEVTRIRTTSRSSINMSLRTQIQQTALLAATSVSVTHNLQHEISQFLFSYYLVELISTQRSQEFRINESFDQYLGLVSEVVRSIATRGFNLDISKADSGQVVNWREVTETLRNIRTSLCKFVTPNLTLLYNREKALYLVDCFLKYIEVNLISTINDSIKVHPDIDLGRLRQTRPKGNIRATLFDSKSGIKCLEKGKGSLFFAGNESGELFTYNLETMNSRDTPSLLLQKYHFPSGVPISKVIADDNCTTIVGKKDPWLSFYDASADKVTREYQLADRAFTVDMKFVQSSPAGVTNSFVSVDDTGKLNVFDVRMKSGAFGMKLNPVMGIPTSLMECSKLFSQYYLSTNRGFLTRYDLRMNMFCEFFRLHNTDGTFLPITSVSEFIPTSKFQHIQESSNCLLLTFPSDNNEFSIFDVDIKGESRDPFNPKIHFVAEFNNSRSKTEVLTTSLPNLRLVENQSIFNLKEDQFSDSFEILKVLAEKKQIFKNNPQSYLNMIDGYMRTLINESNIISGFNISQEIDALIRQKGKDQSLRKVLSHPSQRALKRFENISFDNILFTAGEDRIIRFFNFGNSLDMAQHKYNDCGELPAYHLFNPDLVPRSFYYFFSGREIMIIKENTTPSVVKSNDFNIVNHSFGSDGSGGHAAGSGQSLMQRQNFSSEVKGGTPSLQKSTATPCHELAINDLLMMTTAKGICLISGGDDGYIKIWD